MWELAGQRRESPLAIHHVNLVSRSKYARSILLIGLPSPQPCFVEIVENEIIPLEGKKCLSTPTEPRSSDKIKSYCKSRVFHFSLSLSSSFGKEGYLHAVKFAKQQQLHVVVGVESCVSYVVVLSKPREKEANWINPVRGGAGTPTSRDGK